MSPVVNGEFDKLYLRGDQSMRTPIGQSELLVGMKEDSDVPLTARAQPRSSISVESICICVQYCSALFQERVNIPYSHVLPT
jgi:hypothetical protein